MFAWKVLIRVGVSAAENSIFKKIVLFSSHTEKIMTFIIAQKNRKLKKLANPGYITSIIVLILASLFTISAAGCPPPRHPTPGGNPGQAEEGKMSVMKILLILVIVGCLVMVLLLWVLNIKRCFVSVRGGIEYSLV